MNNNMVHKDPKTFKSEFKGKKTKEALEQELFSLENQAGMIKSPIEMENWIKQYNKVLKEYESKYGKWDIKNWWKWAKK